MTSLHAFIDGLPKAELHMHIEGSLEPELLFALARRNGVEIPFSSVEALRQAYDFADLQSFLDLYYQGADVLREEEDFHDLALAYFRRAAADGVRHTEIFFDPQTHTARNVPFGVMMAGLLSAKAVAERELGMSVRLIMCFLRHLDEEDAFATLRAAEPWLEHITGVGLDSSERGNPPARFERVFAAARALGLRAVAHAGEEGPPAYVTEALDLLKVDRIDHGVAAERDPVLSARLARLGVPLTVCPLSNLKLKGVAAMSEHPIGRMLRKGLRVTVNSDDPAYFGGHVNANFKAIADAGLVTKADLVTLASNSFLGSFLDDAQIAHHLAEIDAYCAGAAG